MMLCQPARANYFLYSDWLRLSEVQRVAYISGAFDAQASIGTDEYGFKLAAHYDRCIVSAHMDNGQLAQNVLIFASQKPETHTIPAAVVLAQYLAATCGKPK